MGVFMLYRINVPDQILKRNFLMMTNVNFEILLGKTITKIDVQPDEILIDTDDGKKYSMHHEQDCCECVYVEDVVGDVEDLVGNPVLRAEVSSNSDDDPLPDSDESHTWTYYKLATIKGHVDIRWYGSSNGYYSESVDFLELS
jgi:hypothetical protein